MHKWWIAALACTLVGSLLPASPAGAATKPDLVVAMVSDPPSDAIIGDILDVQVTTKNAGTAVAGASTTRLYLSSDRARNKGDIKLTPVQRVGRLKPGRKAKAAIAARVPSSAGGRTFFVLACADDARKISESKESNNCRASKVKVDVAPLTTHDLIEADVESGDITEEQGLIFKVFADFSDPRLPDAYAGGAPYTLPDGAVSEVPAIWSTLTADARITLEPFLIPPQHVGSNWAPETAATQSGAAPARAASSSEDVPWKCSFTTDPTKRLPVDENWRFLDSSGGNIRIWWQLRYDETDNETATQLASIAETAYSAVTDVMGKTPISDGGGPCDGESPALDIALVDASTASTLPNNICSPPTAVHMLWPRIIPSQWKHGAPYLAHELAHAAQFAYEWQGAGACPTDDWLMDSTANWIQDYVTAPEYGIGLPGNNTEQDPRATGAFFNAPEKELERKESLHRYGAYLFWFFMARKFGPKGIAQVSSTWQKVGDMSGIEALDASIAGGIKSVWKEFVAHNLNLGAVDFYRQWDGLVAGARMSVDETWGIEDSGYEINLGHLAAQYIRMDFRQEVRTIKIDNPFVGDPNVSLQAHLTFADGTEELRDLSDESRLELCRDIEDQNVREVILIVGNASTDPTDVATGEISIKTGKSCLCEPAASLYSASGESQESGWPCKWFGTASGMIVDGESTTTFTANYTLEVSDQNDQAVGYLVSEGTVEWQFSGTSGGCSLDGSGSSRISGLLAIEDSSAIQYYHHAFGNDPSAPGTMIRTCPGQEPETFSDTPGFDVSTGAPLPYETGQQELKGSRVYPAPGTPDTTVDWQWTLSAG